MNKASETSEVKLLKAEMTRLAVSAFWNMLAIADPRMPLSLGASWEQASHPTPMPDLELKLSVMQKAVSVYFKVDLDSHAGKWVFQNKEALGERIGVNWDCIEIDSNEGRLFRQNNEDSGHQMCLSTWPGAISWLKRHFWHYTDAIQSVYEQDTTFAKNPPRAFDSSLLPLGLAKRKATLGSEYVSKSFEAADDFDRPFQEAMTAWCWGFGWGDEAIDAKTRSMMNLAMIGALGKMREWKLHCKGAIRNGVTVEEIRAIVHVIAIYCGVPQGLECFRAAREALEEEELLSPRNS